MNTALSNTLVLSLANGQTIRMTPTGSGVIGELFVGSDCITFARFKDFAAIGQWADSVIKHAVAAPRNGVAARDL